MPYFSVLGILKYESLVGQLTKTRQEKYKGLRSKNKEKYVVEAPARILLGVIIGGLAVWTSSETRLVEKRIIMMTVMMVLLDDKVRDEDDDPGGDDDDDDDGDDQGGPIPGADGH